jgi:hypothetical protein
MTFSTWLRKSNEAAPFRDAFKAADAISTEHGLKGACFDIIYGKATACWRKTKKDLDLK